jgi:hypothetical protein
MRKFGILAIMLLAAGWLGLPAFSDRAQAAPISNIAGSQSAGANAGIASKAQHRRWRSRRGYHNRWRSRRGYHNRWRSRRGYHNRWRSRRGAHNRWRSRRWRR